MTQRMTAAAGRGGASGSLAPPAFPVHVSGRLDPELRRWRWLVKWFLAIPHLFVLSLLWIATLVLTVAAWFAILVTGRYPRRVFDFNVGVLRWTWRVQFYGFNVLGTDRYPPFSLDSEPDYPADLSIDYPASLSRPLALVKSWLLALPQLLIVLVIVGLPFYTARSLPWSIAAGGLLGVLTLAAMLALSFGGRYPPALFDLIMGLNRWVYRVLAYVLLLRDEYPPFRLDTGGADPTASTSAPQPTMADAGTAYRPTPAAEHRSGLWLTIVGAVLVLGGFALWWLVESTNPSGHHDAQLLPVFFAIPLLIGAFRLFHSRHRAQGDS